MKLKGTLLVVAALGLTILSPAASHAAPFQNLDFEQAFSGPPYNGTPPDDHTTFQVPGASALPHWNWNGPPGSTTNIGYNQVPLDEAGLTLIHQSVPNPNFPGFGPQYLDEYSVNLSDVTLPPIYPPDDISIWQTGTIPIDAQSVHFTVSIDDFDREGFAPPGTSDEYVLNNLIQLSLNGIPITLASTSPANGITHVQNSLFFNGEIAGDVSSFAGQDAVLKLLVGPNRRFSVDVGVQIDDIYFSPVPVPAPSSFALSAAGALGLATIVRRRIKS